ncbi:MAG: hypothetical protein II723_08820 [Oscillospiraceae bacterium]|nr:hypothetical protein [Oscillospiraceae bacterium]
MKKLTKLLSVLSAGVLAVCAAPVSAFAGDDLYIPTNEEVYQKGFEPLYALGNDLSLYEKGDVDMDGEITPYDALMILHQFCFSMIGYPDLLTADQLKLADVDGEGAWSTDPEHRWLSVTAVDGSLTLTYAALKCAGYEMTMEEFLSFAKADS